MTQTDWDSQRVLAVDINRIESISISSQKLLSHSTASSATVEVRQHSQPPPHRHQFLKLEKRNEMNEEKEAASSLDEASEVFRHKRFYPMHVNIGCVKGYKCCTDARCKPFCTLCYGKTILFNSQMKYISIDKLVHFSGYFNGTSNYTTTPKCQDQNENGICDDQEEDDYDESDEQKAEDDDYDESDEQKAEEEDYDESDEIKSDDDDYNESDEQMAERESKTNKTTTQAPHKNSYELTYHLYEEYLPPPTAAPPTPPIIVQAMPHISLNNYFSSHSGQKASLFHPFSPSLNPLVLYVFRQAHSV